MLFNFKGPNLSITTACASSNHAIGLSARLIVAGDADVMIAGGRNGLLHLLEFQVPSLKH